MNLSPPSPTVANEKPETVSVIMPFFHAGHYLRDAIESVLAQDGDVSWRLYLVNDAAKEDTANRLDVEIAREFCTTYSHLIRLLEHPGGFHRGISATRNLGIRSSAGEFIAFLDADDVWYPHALRTHVSCLEAYPDAVMSYGSALRWYSWNGKDADFDVPCTVDGFGADQLVPGAAVLSTFLRDEWLTPCPSAVAVRRSAFDAVGGFEEQFEGLFDDQVLFTKLCLQGQVYITSDRLSKYRRHPESCCSQAEVNGTEAAERKRFEEWLAAYRQAFAASTQASATTR